MTNITDSQEWRALAQHQRDIADQHMRDCFAADLLRFPQFTLSAGHLFLDYSRNRISTETLSLLTQLAYAAKLPEKIEALFSGLPVNTTEMRPALHTALRDKERPDLRLNGENISDNIKDCLQKMQSFVDQIHTGQWLGITGKSITHIVNIGIGGSHTGPMLCTDALKEFRVKNLHCHFISSVDKAHVDEVLEQIDPETTLFIISSKSFSTLETLTNARTVLNWMQSKYGATVIRQHFIAVTAEPEKARAFGLLDKQIFPLWYWVGGRYSIWSAIGLPLMLLIGAKHFEDFLEGAYDMDQHFRNANFSQNMPVLLALLSIWYTNFFAAKAQAIIPYAHRLRHLVPYLQQTDMESNGKNRNSHGELTHYATGAVLFGAEGSIGQHTYHQLLHQGNHLIPVDFILVGKAAPNDNNHHQDILMASGLSQSQALMRGKTYEEACDELRRHQMPEHELALLANHQVIPGNKPSNILYLDQITPKTLGALIALYEHKIFVQSVIWDINSFDQWGIELGKQLLPPILERLQQSTSKGKQNDLGLSGFISHLKASIKKASVNNKI